MDQVDLAQKLEQEYLQRSLSTLNGSSSSRPSATHFADCGEAIPDGRRKIIPGVQKCVNCAD
ncbi:TraR/DksA C4-type zinc finger protein [Terasakiella sp. A23]|uniref:TraR/DksA C4-type zinc finger protein n=1 Tax=Terasakiella sp. FCG-A23 TaxID=3080561 RepID=UPI0029548210|nr:TraR/DksA C4-type zinc finger protein [Terasakiella sp. A23]MDV7340995.1 TraR/DksA C4-type zinc finger protein [Terasakiella sp. A23]